MWPAADTLLAIRSPRMVAGGACPDRRCDRDGGVGERDIGIRPRRRRHRRHLRVGGGADALGAGARHLSQHRDDALGHAKQF